MRIKDTFHEQHLTEQDQEIILPFPLTSISPRSLTLNEDDSSSRVDSDMCICMDWLVASIRAAVLTESPKRQYRGIFKPTIPATTAPLWMPTRIWRWLPVKINVCLKKNGQSFFLFCTCRTILEIGYCLDHIESHIAYAIRMIVFLYRRTRDYHVSITDGFDLG